MSTTSTQQLLTIDGHPITRTTTVSTPTTEGQLTAALLAKILLQLGGNPDDLTVTTVTDQPA